MNKIDEKEIGGSEVHPFAFYPEMIAWKLQQLDSLPNNHLKESLRVSIIIDCACLVEGTLNTINREMIFNESFSSNSLRNRLLEQLKQRFEKGQFTDYINIYNIIVGKDLKNLSGNELWKCITTLFAFRNNLVHGNVIEIEEYESNRGIRLEVYNSYKSIYKYCIEKKLLDTYSKDPDTLLFSNDILTFFYRSSLDFIKILVKNVPKHSKDFVNEMTVFLVDKSSTTDCKV